MKHVQPIMRKRHPAFTGILFVFLVLILAACSSQAAPPAARSTPTAGTSVSAADAYATATTFFNQGNCPSAIKAYAQAISKNPAYVSAYMGEASCYRQMGSYYQSLLAYNKAIAADPLNANLYYLRAQIEQLNGQNGASYADCSTSAKLVGGNALAALQQAATCLAGFGDYQGAVRALSTAIRLSPTSSEMYRLRAQNEGRSGDTAAVNRDVKLALRYSTSTPQTAQVLATQADYYASQGDYNRAVRLYTRVVQLAPNLGWPWVNLGKDLAANGDVTQALQTFEKGERITPPTSWTVVTYEAQGDLLSQLGRKNDAAAAYRLGIRTSTDPSQKAELQARLVGLSG